MSVVTTVSRKQARFTEAGSGRRGARGTMGGGVGLQPSMAGNWSRTRGSLSIGAVILSWLAPVAEARLEGGRGLPQVPQVLAGLEADRLPRRDAHLGAGPGITTDSLLARFDLEDAEAAQLDPLAPAHRLFHGVQDRFDGNHRLDARDIGVFGHIIDDIGLDHPPAS